MEELGEIPIASLLQKALFLAVILGCVGVYLRINSTKKAREYEEKSMA
jgi:hypothetical protein